MKEPSYAAKVVRTVILSTIIVATLEAFQIAHLPPAARPGRIFSLVVAFAACGVIAVLTVRKRALSPENPRLSPFTLAAITVSVILVAVLFRPSKMRPVASPDLQTSSWMNSQQLSGLFILVCGITITLWAYGIVAQSQRERLDPAMVQRLKWLGPVTLVLGLCQILFHARS